MSEFDYTDDSDVQDSDSTVHGKRRKRKKRNKPEDNTLGLKIAVAVLAVAVVLLAIKVFWPAKPASTDANASSSGKQAESFVANSENGKASDSGQTSDNGKSAGDKTSNDDENTGGDKTSVADKNTDADRDSDADKNAVSDKNSGADKNTDSGKASDADKNTDGKSSDNKKSSAKGGYLLTYSAGNGWVDGGTNMCTMDFSVTNQTDESVKNWILVLTVDGLASISGWNGSYEADGNTLTITPADYNSEIFENGTIYLGCNIGTTGTLKISKATLNGKECVVESGYVNQNDQNAGNGNQNSNDANTGSGTTAVDVEAMLKRADNAKQGDDWLHTDGRRILDKDGKEVWLTGVNWFGYNTGTNTFDGLWNSKMEPTVKAIADHGFNLIRVPMSAQLINQWAAGEYPRANFNQAYNVAMTKMNSLEIFDYFLTLAEASGIKVMIDIHSAETDASGHNVNLWYTSKVSVDQYYSALEWMAARYKNNDTIIAYDLKNEPHGKPNEGNNAAIWNDSKQANNWKYVAETAAAKVLAKNPNVLIMVEGTEIYPKNSKGDYSSTNSADYYFNWWGGNLRAVKDFPIDLGKYQDKLVYSPHDYGPTVYEQPWFKGTYTYDSLMEDCWHDNWFYIYEDNTAPLLIGEWGGFMREPNLTWMTYMRKLISTYHLNHTFWCLNANSGDTGGLLLDDFTTWDKDKYNFVKEVLWQEGGKFVGLDHEIPLGDNGISLKDAKGLK